jgi:hypothetical protein
MTTISKALKGLAFACLILTPIMAAAQTSSPSPAAPPPNEQLLKPEQLDALVAPIALYPDTLLAEVLMASTYPLEVVEAARWTNENKNLKGEQLKAAVEKKAWDDSVKSLVATPSVLEMMNTKLDWTQKLGDAVLAQQPDVMDSIQRLRARAQANGKLESTKEQKVSVRQEENRQVIAIEPGVPDTVYVPYYDPAVVYGGWPYPDYPPYYFGAPGYIGGAVLATGLAFGAGYAVGRWASGGNYWGGGVNWGNRNINVNRPINVNNVNANNWQHNPQHRQGVRYNNANVAQRFGNNNLRTGSQQRMDFRGRSGEQVLKPGSGGAAQRGNVADRAAAGRTNAGDRNRATAGRGTVGERGGKQQRANVAKNRPAGGAGRGGRDSALNVGSGRAAKAQSARGHASVGNRSFASASGARPGGGVRAGGAPRAGGGGGGMRGGGGGRRSDILLKHDITLLGRLDNGLGFYRFVYNGGRKAYVGVMAQEVRTVMPEAVALGADGYLRVYYDKLGVTFQTYDHWIASGARIPSSAPASAARNQTRTP